MTLPLNSYTWKNALLWGNFSGHVNHMSQGSLGKRIIHLIIAAAELLPIISQIASIFEKIIITKLCSTEGIPFNSIETEPLIPVSPSNNLDLQHQKNIHNEPRRHSNTITPAVIEQFKQPNNAGAHNSSSVGLSIKALPGTQLNSKQAEPLISVSPSTTNQVLQNQNPLHIESLYTNAVTANDLQIKHLYNAARDSTPCVGLSSKALLGTQLNIGLNTPGVNLLGTDLGDRQFVQKRIAQVIAEIGPHAHTYQSLEAYRSRINTITIAALSGESYITSDQIIAMHQHYKRLMIGQFGRQLTVSIFGMGPIGLSAAIAFYKLGFKVCGFEKRSAGGAEGYCQRGPPFALMRQSFWFLNSLGVSREKILEIFNYKLPQEGNLIADEFKALSNELMEKARRDVIGNTAIGYIPSYPSLPTREVQSLLSEVIFAAIMQKDKEDIEINFSAHCIDSVESFDGRRTLSIQTKIDLVSNSPDMIYNATGGKMNELLKFQNKAIATYYGMGAFFPRPKRPSLVSPKPKELSRAVRVFCDYNNNHPVYCNVELSPQEFQHIPDFEYSETSRTVSNDEEEENKQQLPKIITQVMRDVGLQAPFKVFKVKIDLKHVITAGLTSKKNEQLPQLSFCGGDSLLQPHFITASGANFGLLGLIGLELSLRKWIEGKITQDKVVLDYNATAQLLQKQSYQTILELFGRHLSTSVTS